MSIWGSVIRANNSYILRTSELLTQSLCKPSEKVCGQSSWDPGPKDTRKTEGSLTSI